MHGVPDAVERLPALDGDRRFDERQVLRLDVRLVDDGDRGAVTGSVGGMAAPVGVRRRREHENGANGNWQPCRNRGKTWPFPGDLPNAAEPLDAAKTSGLQGVRISTRLALRCFASRRSRVRIPLAPLNKRPQIGHLLLDRHRSDGRDVPQSCSPRPSDRQARHAAQPRRFRPCLGR